ncbi:hypothetical protein ACFLRF_05850 [Candidatus Altiarchaeota archaeon]
MRVLHAVRDKNRIDDALMDGKTFLGISSPYVHGDKAPQVEDRASIERISQERRRRGFKQLTFVDIAIDQGGSIPDIAPDWVELANKPAYHDDPFHVDGAGQLRYTVANMPGRPGTIAKIASQLLQDRTLDYTKKLLGGLKKAVDEDADLGTAINAIDGKLTLKEVADLFGLKHSNVSENLRDVFSGKRKLVLGIPKEIKQQEGRVGLLPSGVKELLRFSKELGLDLEVRFEKGLGERIGISDTEYIEMGAKMVGDADDLWAGSDMIQKVKEPLPDEYDRMKKGQLVFTYFHLASNETLTRKILERQITAVAYETLHKAEKVHLKDPRTYGSHPLLDPMSWVAGVEGALVGTAVEHGAIEVVHNPKR